MPRVRVHSCRKNMKKLRLVILGITSVICSRALFALFDDPEGPNLLIVLGMAALLYSASLLAYVPGPSSAGSKRFAIAILVQVLLAIGLYLLLS